MKEDDTTWEYKKTVEVEQKEMLETYADVFEEFDEEMKNMMGTTVLNKEKLHKYFQHIHAFYLSELTAMEKRIHDLEQQVSDKK